MLSDDDKLALKITVDCLLPKEKTLTIIDERQLIAPTVAGKIGDQARLMYLQTDFGWNLTVASSSLHLLDLSVRMANKTLFGIKMHHRDNNGFFKQLQGSKNFLLPH